MRENDILDQNTLDRDSPLLADAFDDRLNFGGDCFPVGENTLKVSGTNDMTQGSLGALDESSTNISNSVGGTVRVDWSDEDQLRFLLSSKKEKPTDVIHEYGIDVDSDIVLSHDILTRNSRDLNLDVDLIE